MGCGDLLEHGVVKGLIPAAAQGRPGLRLHLIVFHGLQSALLGEIGVQLHLVYHGPDLHRLAEIGEHMGIEVADANGPQLALLVGLLHGPPGAEVVLHGLVEQVQVQIFQPHGIEGSVDGFSGCLIILHVLHPHLGGDEQLFPGADSLGDSFLYRLAHGVLVGVGGGGVDEPVARFDGVQHRAFALLLIPHLEDPKALHGHFDSVVQHCVFHDDTSRYFGVLPCSGTIVTGLLKKQKSLLVRECKVEG